MAASVRRQAILDIAHKRPVHENSLLDGFSPTADFGADVFSEKVMRRLLPKSAFKTVKHTIECGGREQLDPMVADQVASAMKDWALERGATHFTHWFQPLTGTTAEKHDSFLDIYGAQEPLMEFSGKELIKGEPDASSFPSGGIRSTFEARGYTAWDPSSPAFIRRAENGNTLCIPTAFCSWTGEALDKKTPLLRSDEALSREAVRMLRHLGEGECQSVFSTLGAEQEFFLVDRGFYLARPDLCATGRSLLGARPPKGQQLEDHYFGAIHPRIMACIQEAEKELWRLGVPQTTRHNEVSPAQYEMAPIYEKAAIGCDHNLLQMEILRECARRHGFECLLHEKPFAGVNGSGKHNNWSMSTDKGENLLDPGRNPHTNLRFIVFLTAVVKAVDAHADLLRAAIATPSNDHRLGANEAPPAIISIFLGTQLQEVVEDLMVDDALGKGRRKTQYLELGVSTLPALPRDQTDRNRTSPFAFTGNKFEFRAVGSAQTCARPVTTLNTAVADALRDMNNQLEELMSQDFGLELALRKVLKDTLKQHGRVIFNGNNYDEEWHIEAEKVRGLPNNRATPEALVATNTEKNIELWERLGVMNRTETEARHHVYLENYCKHINIEANMLQLMVNSYVLPAAMKHQEQVANSVMATKKALKDVDVLAQEGALRDVASNISDLILSAKKLCKEVEEADKLAPQGPEVEAKYYREAVIPAMDEVRRHSDYLELVVDDDLWPLPKYSEILFLR